jgi:hypothetical protein
VLRRNCWDADITPLQLSHCTQSIFTVLQEAPNRLDFVSLLIAYILCRFSQKRRSSTWTSWNLRLIWGNINSHNTKLSPNSLISFGVKLTSSTGGGRSVGIVRSRTKATELSFSWSIRMLSPILRFWQAASTEMSAFDFLVLTIRKLVISIQAVCSNGQKLGILLT